MTTQKTHDCNSQNSKISQMLPYSLISTHHIVIPCQSDVSPIFFDLKQKRMLEGKGGQPVPSNKSFFQKHSPSFKMPRLLASFVEN